MSVVIPTVGTLLREWRQRRRMSQLDLACLAGVSTRHLSFVETGRTQPSREMVCLLAETLRVPMREQNTLLLAAGYAPCFSERPIDHPGLRVARNAVNRILAGHEPYPALAIDSHWTLLAANRAVAPLLAGADPRLLAPPINVLRLTLHPDGLGRNILNYRQCREHMLAKMNRQYDGWPDQKLAEMIEEVSRYREPAEHTQCAAHESDQFVVPLELSTEQGRISLFSTTSVFGTATEVTLSEIAIESFFPADEESGERLRQLIATQVTTRDNALSF